METFLNWMFTFQFYQQSTSIVIFSFTNSVIILGYKESLREAERGLDYPELQFLGASIIMKVATPQRTYQMLQSAEEKSRKDVFLYIFSFIIAIDNVPSSLPLLLCLTY